MAQTNWSFYSLVILLLALLGAYLWYERRRATAREIALIATLAALAGLSRVPFTVVPSLQPTTFLALISGYVFGAGPGFMVGSLAAFISNFFLGHGPWTPWQMAAWGIVGICGGLLGRKRKHFPLLPMVLLAVVWGFFFGWFLNIWHWLTVVYPLTLRSFLLTQSISLWNDILHALGNGAFMGLAGPELVRLLTRFKNKMSARALPAQENTQSEIGKTDAKNS